MIFQQHNNEWYCKHALELHEQCWWESYAVKSSVGVLSRHIILAFFRFNSMLVFCFLQSSKVEYFPNFSILVQDNRIYFSRAAKCREWPHLWELSSSIFYKYSVSEIITRKFSFAEGKNQFITWLRLYRKENILR